MRETGSQEQTIAGLLEGILCGVVAVLFFLGAGLYFWKTYKKERNTKTQGQGGHRHTQLPGVAPFLDLEEGRKGRS